MAYVKLDTKILDSTLWVDREAREIFVTALLMAEPREFLEPVLQISVRTLDMTGWAAPAGWYGWVPAAGVGIVRRAGTEQESGLDALERLGSPEPDSRNPLHEGRRLIRSDGGYLVLNYMRYRDYDHSAAERQRRLRERRRVTRDSNGVTRDTGVTSRIADADADADADAEKKNSKIASLHKQVYANEFEIFKTIYPKRSGSQPWNKAYKALSARLAGGVVWGEVESGALRYAQWCRETGKVGTEFVMQAARFLGPEQQFLLAWELPTTKAEARLDGNLDAMERAKHELFGER